MSPTTAGVRAEINVYGTDPVRADTDHDGLLDGDEVLVQGSDPLHPDTDGDTIGDADEVLLYGTDPTDGDNGCAWPQSSTPRQSAPAPRRQR